MKLFKCNFKYDHDETFAMVKAADAYQALQIFVGSFDSEGVDPDDIDVQELNFDGEIAWCSL